MFQLLFQDRPHQVHSDTHVFLWYITADPKLPAIFRTASQNPANEVSVIKYHLGKLPLPAPPADYLPQQRNAHGIASLPIDEGTMPYLAGLSPKSSAHSAAASPK